MHVAIHSFNHDGEEFVRGKTRVRSDHPVVAEFPHNFAPAPDRSPRRSVTRSTERAPSGPDLEEELAYRREQIAASRVRRREDERAREKEERRKAREDEKRFWDETAELLAGSAPDMRAALDELDAGEQRELEEADMAAYRTAQLDPSSQDFWDESIAIGERLRLDPDGTVAAAVREENARIRRSKEIEKGELELWEGLGE